MSAFTATVTLAQLDRLARHPYVARIEPIPGQAAFLGVTAPPAPPQCPQSRDFEPVASKASGAESIREHGRQPVVIDLKEAGVLPPASERTDCSGQACASSDDVMWERTILNRRQYTCVLRALDRLIVETPFRVDYASATGDLTAPPLPPLGDPVSTTKSFAIGLTWPEASGIAAHPYVERVWASEELQPAPAACMTDLSTFTASECSNARDSTEAKVSAADRERWHSAAGPQSVLIVLKTDPPLCPLAACPSAPESCPENERIISHRRAVHDVLQRCVKQLVTEVGGTIVSEETLWLINAFSADLTWEQILAVASHPDVKQIESNGGSSLP